MFAIEFHTTIKNGMIEIPEEYQDNLSEHVKVILLADDIKAHPVNKVDQLLKTPLKIENFQPFTREKIYESK